MRIVVIGGTRFIGRAIVAALAEAGHELLVVHRGQSEPPELSAVEHAHVDRRDAVALQAALATSRAEAVIDTFALTRADAEGVVAAAPRGARLLVLSSMDVYRAYTSLHEGTESDPLPLDETSPVRSQRYPYRGQLPGMDDYEKLDVEEVYAQHGATICRLPMVYGPHDGQRREEFILRRVRAGRERIPIGGGSWLSSRGYVADIATAVRLATESEAARDQVLNLNEETTWTMAGWARQILTAAGATAELVRVPEAVLPDDLNLTRTMAQHLLVSSVKARALLGWTPTDPTLALARSVQWHLAHPPPEPDADFTADDQALAAAESQ